MDPTDAVAVVDAASNVKALVKEMDAKFGDYLAQDKNFGPEGLVNPEISQNPEISETGGNRIIAVSDEDVKAQKSMLHVSLAESYAYVISHGAGHNAGLDHPRSYNDVPFGSIMTSGSDVLTNCNQGKNPVVPEFSMLRHFITSIENQGSVKDAYEKRFGKKTSTPSKNIQLIQ